MGERINVERVSNPRHDDALDPRGTFSHAFEPDDRLSGRGDALANEHATIEHGLVTVVASGIVDLHTHLTWIGEGTVHLVRCERVVG
jgi:hypothetical protein